MSDELTFSKMDGFSDDDLLNELLDRFDNFIYSYEKFQGESKFTEFEWKGDQGECKKMCKELLEDIDTHEFDEDDD